MTVANLLAGLTILGQYGADPLPVDIIDPWIMVPVAKGTIPVADRQQLIALGWVPWWKLRPLPQNYVKAASDFNGTWRVPV